jgi:hypothetical protein
LKERWLILVHFRVGVDKLGNVFAGLPLPCSYLAKSNPSIGVCDKGLLHPLTRMISRELPAVFLFLLRDLHTLLESLQVVCDRGLQRSVQNPSTLLGLPHLQVTKACFSEGFSNLLGQDPTPRILPLIVQ